MSSQNPKEAIKEVEEATFSMREELKVKEAAAAVEECYRRRARRVGLVEMLPTDRPMTEGELDTLSELLGDGAGDRAKRRREIEEMTLEEMEAEHGEVKAEIRRRRRAGRGWLPLSLVLLLCFAGHPAEGCTAYNCSNRSNIVEAYSLLEPDACANMGKEGEAENTVYGEIVQIKQDRMIPVFRCIVIETLISQYCGMFSAAGSRDTSGSGSSSHWSAAKRGKAGRSSSMGGRSKARPGQPPCTACTWLADWTMRAGVKSASSHSPTARR
jgi:hypothetical protein